MEGTGMIRLLSYLARFFLIVLGYVLAVLAACAFILVLGWGGLIGQQPDQGELVAFAVSLSLPVATAFAGYYSFLPAMIFALIAEILGRRSCLFHAIGGMVVAAAALAARPEEISRPGIFMIVLAAGAVGGTAYWLIAGRSSGRTLDRAADTLPPTSPSSGS
jgi:hypothetical protein